MLIRIGITIEEWHQIDGQEVALPGKRFSQVLRKKPGKKNTLSLYFFFPSLKPFSDPGSPPLGVAVSSESTDVCLVQGAAEGLKHSQETPVPQPGRPRSLSPSFLSLRVTTCNR